MRGCSFNERPVRDRIRYFNHVFLRSRQHASRVLKKHRDKGPRLLIPKEKSLSLSFSLLMTALIFAARALVSAATLSYNGVELAPAFPLAGAASSLNLRTTTLAATTPSPIFIRDL